MGLLRSLATAAASALLLGLHGSDSVASAASTGVAEQHRVSLRVFFRAFWYLHVHPPTITRHCANASRSVSVAHHSPACQWFVGDPLLELVRTEEYRNIVNLT